MCSAVGLFLLAYSAESRSFELKLPKLMPPFSQAVGMGWNGMEWDGGTIDGGCVA